MNCSLYNQISDRMNITRTDQVYVYPRRTYRRLTRHNPYTLTLPIEQKNIKTEIVDNNEVMNQSEEKSNENLNNNNNDIKIEAIVNLNDDQVVIPNEYIQSNKMLKRRLMMNFNCQNCQQKFKTKNQLNTHLIKCQYESEQT